MRRLAAAFAAVVMIATAGCGSGGGGSEQEGGVDKVDVGVIPIVDVAPIYLGKAQGFFADEKIEVNLVEESGGAAAVPGVVSGQFTFAFGNVVSLLVAQTQGIQLKAIAEGNSSTGKQGKDFGGVVVPKDSPIKSAKDLAGKQVAVNNLKNIGDTTIRASIRKAGGDPSSVKFTELPFPEMPAAVAKKRVDAAWIVEPFFTVAKDQGARLVASNFVDAAPDLTIATYFTSAQTIEKDKDLVDRFTRAIQKSLKYAREHPDEVRKVLPTYTKIEPSVAEKITLPAWPDDINEESVRTIAGLMVKDGLVKKEPDVSALLK